MSAIETLGNRTKHIEVVNVRAGGDNAPIEATVFVPTAAETYYQDKVAAYRNAPETKTGRPQNEPLVARMDTVRIATVQSLFTDSPALYPVNGQTVWWEVWLRHGRRDHFNFVADRLNLPRKDHTVSFPERDVVLVLANEAAMTRIIRNCDSVAEFRIAKDTPALFLNMGSAEAKEWTDDVLARLVPPDGALTAVCLLDSGVTQGHPLISPALHTDDMHTVNPDWGVADTAEQWDGHGTRMSGIALYGDLHTHFEGTAQVDLSHRLESVKILPPENQNEPDLYGGITQQAVYRAEVQAPHRNRVVCMAVTSTHLEPGRPSSWSAAVDQLCFDEESRRLVVLSAGNLRGDIEPAQYIDRNDVEPVEDPAQAWNALTVGAYTDRVNITDPAFAGWQPVGQAGDLSPTSRTSVSWPRQWPIKPDVVFEGGNLASDGNGEARPIDDLQLLTTSSKPRVRMLTNIGDTSAATALAANMAARIMTMRPGLWPETVRGLIVHSAEWTPAMFARLDGQSKSKKQALLRRYGYGVPDLDRALLSAANDLTLMVEDQLTPFEKDGGTIKTRDMKVHRLPWPREELSTLGDAQVSFRVTLSYFIEPNPGERGWTRRHRYASHSLRFAVKHATETLPAFRSRINKVARDEEEGLAVGGGAAVGDNWFLGATIREHGSIHSDWWTGTAVDLASRDAIGVFPVGGWWKEKGFLGRHDNPVRYSLIVSIRAAGSEVDIYTPVSNKISISADIQRN
ncbi:hypothetical protein K678_16000 [Magnetospirillum fulvum MGU-K5]|uniref:Peptidase S8/S53 domain-containing protein n=2 Tax=Magnetospirillum fulvum TaxID=1082 RepID=S9TPD8_MAGFU|nr:hypothetical protein K678_16000 [Magnetospirillum fulvum MGU-K5]